MSNESKRVQTAASTQNVLAYPNRITTARRVAGIDYLFALVALVIFSAACGNDSNKYTNDGSGGGGAAVETIETQPVDLPPGETQASLAWEPSNGPVDEYLVFTSRNGSTFDYETSTPTPSASIPGRPGDEIQIVVAALSDNGSLSETSPPSVPVRFHASSTNTSATASRIDDTPKNVPAAIGFGSNTLASAADSTTEIQIAAQPETQNGNSPESAATRTQIDEEAETELAEAEATLEDELLERLLGADARLARRGQSNAADAWIQSFVDDEIAAGVAFVGTGNANDDALRELVWQDSAGQLFVSDGQTFLNSNTRADTLVESIRLQTGERFVAFENLGGAMGSEWLIENTLTGQVFVTDADAESTEGASTLNDGGDGFRLIGLGDFDGDDQGGDLLWHNDERGTLVLGMSESGGVPNDGIEIAIPENRQSDLPLAVADLNGDGRDGLLSQDAAGRLRMTLFMPSPGGEAFDAFWAGGADAAGTGLELVGILDLDRDGEAEIAWVDDDGLQIWDANDGPEILSDF